MTWCIVRDRCRQLALELAFGELDVWSSLYIRSSLIWSLTSCCNHRLRWTMLISIDHHGSCCYLLLSQRTLCHFAYTFIDTSSDIVLIDQVALGWKLLLEVID